MPSSHEEYTGLYFVYGFPSLTPLLLLKSMGSYIFDDEFPIDLLGLMFNNTCEARAPFRA
jgi:hypothetical protein